MGDAGAVMQLVAVADDDAADGNDDDDEDFERQFPIIYRSEKLISNRR